MPSYTSDQINALQGYINVALSALNAGNDAGVVSARNSHYGTQTGCGVKPRGCESVPIENRIVIRRR